MCWRVNVYYMCEETIWGGSMCTHRHVSMNGYVGVQY